MSDPCFLSATELRRLIDARRISCREVLDAHIARIEAVNPTLNAIVTETFEAAQTRADELDSALSGDLRSTGVLAGLPIAHKDLVATKGIRTTYGSPLYANHVPASDDLIIERMRRAGAVTIGKTNTPEFGAGSHTFNRVFGATRNPYHLGRTCGGSSGGAAVALAAHMAPIADGSDTGGSLRNPAAFCNVVGFRPSPGCVPLWPGNPWSDLSTAGPMARNVDDTALLFSVLAGPDPRIPHCLPKLDPFLPLEPVDVSGLRIAVTEDFGLPVQRPIRDAIGALRQTLADAGATIVDAAPDLRDARRIFHILRADGFRRRFGAFTDGQRSELKETIIWNLDAGLELTVADHDWAVTARTALAARIGAFFQEVDLLIGPTTQVLPFDINADWVREIDGQPMATYIEWMESCSLITVTCCPALSLPAGFADGLPVGAQLVAPLREDVFLLRAAKGIEEVLHAANPAPPPLAV